MIKEFVFPCGQEGHTHELFDGVKMIVAEERHDEC
jgi:hypothetical protein